MPGVVANAAAAVITIAVPFAIAYGFYQSNPWIKILAGAASGAIGVYLLIVCNLRFMR